MEVFTFGDFFDIKNVFAIGLVTILGAYKDHYS